MGFDGTDDDVFTAARSAVMEQDLVNWCYALYPLAVDTKACIWQFHPYMVVKKCPFYGYCVT